jgi:transcriptional regulator with XRE-family HTH domain
MCVKHNDIGKRIKELRIHMKLTQREFADRIYSSYRSVQNWETGERFISENNLRLLIDECKVSSTWLRTGVGEMFSSDKDNNFSKIYTPASELLKIPYTMERTGLFAFVSDCDSMSPVICKGDIVLWKKYDNCELISGSYVVLNMNGKLSVRKVVINKGLTSFKSENGSVFVYNADNTDVVLLGIVTDISSLKSLSSRE